MPYALAIADTLLPLVDSYVADITLRRHDMLPDTASWLAYAIAMAAYAAHIRHHILLPLHVRRQYWLYGHTSSYGD